MDQRDQQQFSIGFGDCMGPRAMKPHTGDSPLHRQHSCNLQLKNKLAKSVRTFYSETFHAETVDPVTSDPVYILYDKQ